MSARPDHLRRCLALAALAVVVCGYLLVRGAERTIALHADDVRASDQRATRLAVLLARAPALEAERSRLQRRVQTVDLGEDAARLVARFLRGIAQTAARDHVAVLGIGAPDAHGAPTADDRTIPLDLDFSGRYTDVLAAITDLGHTGAPAAVDVVSLARVRTDESDRTLTASLHVALVRLEPVSDVRTRTR
ncbi:MAG: hypothetical protein ABR975_09165 [Vulcanimicrobiaceae bacterium]